MNFGFTDPAIFRLAITSNPPCKVSQSKSTPDSTLYLESSLLEKMPNLYPDYEGSELFEQVELKEDENRPILTNVELWFDTGSALFNSAEALRQMPPSTVRVVGGAIGRLVDDESAFMDYERVAEMLFAMAVEAWLKGLIIAVVPKSREELAKYWDYLDSCLPKPEGDTTNFASILDVVKSGTAKAMHASVEAASLRTEEDRIQRLDRKYHHRLSELADAANVGPLEDLERQYFLYLETMNRSGRYPTVWMPPKPEKENPKAQYAWTAGGSTESVRASLFQKIRDRYDSIRSNQVSSS